MDVGKQLEVTRSEISAGGLVARRSAAGVEVLIARQHDRNRGDLTGRLPKGHLDPGETLIIRGDGEELARWGQQS